MGSVVKSAVGAVGGAGPAAMIGGSLIGGLLSSRAASKQAAAQNAQAAAEMQMARLAAEEARFRPIGFTTRLASATPQFDSSGRLTGYTTQASPELAEMQRRVSGLGGGVGASLAQAERAAALQPRYEQAAQRLMNLGEAYIPQTQEEVVAEQMALLRPYDIEEEQRLAASVFGRGRGGLNLSVGGQPELQALAESRARRGERIAAAAPELTASRAGLGAGMFTQAGGLLATGYQGQVGALSPFQAQLQTQQALIGEELRPIEVGSALGAKQAVAGQNVGGALMTGQQSAGALQTAAASAKSQGLAALGQGIQGLGAQYAAQQQQNKVFNDWLNRAYPQTPATIESRAIGSGLMQPRGYDLLGGQYGFSSGFPYI